MSRIDAANSMTLGADGVYFVVDGTKQINLIESKVGAAQWKDGQVVILRLNEALTIKHNQAASVTFVPIKLKSGADLQAQAGAFLQLVFDVTDNCWSEL